MTIYGPLLFPSASDLKVHGRSCKKIKHELT